MTDLTLPSIVAQIREQKPDIVPLSLWLDEAGWCDCNGGTDTHRMTEETVIAVLEAALWRKVMEMFSHGKLYTLSVDTAPRATFQPDSLAVIRALCQPIGVTLREADCPHRRTTRDASGGIICDACGEEITRG